jgi:osmotically inducible protein OsmC
MQSRATAQWSGDLFSGSGTTTLAGSGAAGPLPVSWASRTEESAGRTSPEELIAAAHAAYYNMALSNGLAQAGHPAEQLDTEAVAAFERTDAGWRLTTMALLVRGNVPGMDAATFAEQAAAAKDGCPVSNALKGNVEITVDAALV